MKHLFIFSALLVSTLCSATIEDATLMTIGDREISVGEFEYLYNKNNQVSSTEENTLEEYVDLFINFKLKVIEAEELGLDTASTFVEEFGGYRNQLAEPYLKDQDLDDKLINEAYNRLKEEVEASHILIKIDSESASDTLKAYTKAMEARAKVLAGEDFEAVAKAYSSDPSAQTNGGYLGYFSGFQMVLPFEEAAFNTDVNEVSMPSRSKFGYHVIKVHSRRPSSGEVNLSHILVLSNDKMSAEVQAQKKDEAFAIYQSILDGKNFEEVAKKSSEDRGSASKGGNIGFIRRGQTIKAFEEAAYALENNGDMTAPVLTRFGWHIIRLEGKKGIPSFEDKKADIKRRLARDERGTKPEKVFLANLKKEYDFSLNEQNLNELYESATGRKADSSLLSDFASMDKTIMSFGDKTLTQYDYIKYCVEANIDGTNFESKIKDFEKANLLAYEKTQLVRKYPDYKYLLNEYHDGLLLFEISNEKVWGRASKDEEGLEKFYKKNKKNYRFDQASLDGKVTYIKDSTTLLAYNAMKENMDIDAITDSLNQNGEVIKIEESFYKLGDNTEVDAFAFEKQEVPLTEEFTISVVEGTLYEEGDIKPLNATRGACISDYQEYLEAKWIKSLRKEYKISIDKDQLAKLNK